MLYQSSFKGLFCSRGVHTDPAPSCFSSAGTVWRLSLSMPTGERSQPPPLFLHQRPICWVYFPDCAPLCSLGFLFGGFLGMFPPNSGTSRRYGVHQNRPGKPDQRLRHDGSARYFFDHKEENEHDGLERRTLRQVEKTTRFG